MSQCLELAQHAPVIALVKGANIVAAVQLLRRKIEPEETASHDV